jgi:outer membrane receptor for ferric coprogen and ferric-rhodotorulic acid
VQAQKEEWEHTIWSLDAYASGTAELFGRTHELMVGVNGLHDEGSSNGGTVEGIDNPFGYHSILQISHAFDHDPTSVPEPSADDWMMWGAWDWTAKQYGGYAGGRFSINDPTHLIVGARAAKWEYEDANGTTDYSAVIPYAAVTYDFSGWGTVYAAYSGVYDPVNWAIDTSFQPIDPREGHNYEVGVKGNFFDGRLDASLAVYRLDQKNIPQEDLEGGMICNGWYCYTASGQVITDGVDAGLSGQLTPDWSILAGYSYAYSEEQDGGLPFNTYYPEHTAKLATTYDLPGGRWTVGGQVRYQSEVYDEGVFDETGGSFPYRVEQPGYTLVDLMAKYRIIEDVHVVLNVDNVFDKTYYDGISYVKHGNTYGAPRTASLTLRAAF